MEEDKHKILKEPAVDYISNISPNLTLLFGQSIHRSAEGVDLIAITRKGLPRRSLDIIAESLGVKLEFLCDLLHVSYRNMLRKNAEETLNVHITEQLLSIADLLDKGLEVMGDPDNFKEWLHSEIPSLGSERPIDYLDTSFGISRIKRILGRIEHGVF